MLEPKHIVRLCINKERLEAHKKMPMPYYVTKPLVGKFNAISETVIAKLLKVDDETFLGQLNTARRMGTSFVCENEQKKLIGVSAATSLLKGGDIIYKHVIVPTGFMHVHRQLEDKIIIGAFVRGSVVDGDFPDPDMVEVAGWANVADIERWRMHNFPTTFHSNLEVQMIPCKILRPIDTLLDTVSTNALCV